MPKVVDQLRSHPQDEAIVTVAVYQDPNKPDEHAMISVTFNGLANQVGPTFITDVVNNLKTLPQADGIPNNLVLDPQATSYLVFFFGNHSLEAGDVTQAQIPAASPSRPTRRATTSLPSSGMPRPPRPAASGRFNRSSSATTMLNKPRRLSPRSTTPIMAATPAFRR